MQKLRVTRSPIVNALGLVLLSMLASSVWLPQPALAESDKPEVIGAYISRGLKDVAGAELDFSSLGRAGVNLVIDYRLAAPEPGNQLQQEAWQNYIAAARDNGIGISFFAGRYLFGANPENPAKKLDAVVAAVNKLKSEPAIVSWYMHDEILPSVSRGNSNYSYTITLEQMRELYLRVHEADPSRPQLSVWPELKEFEEFSKGIKPQNFMHGTPDWASSASLYEAMLREMVSNTCDIPMLDVYPVGKPRPLATIAYRKTVSSRLGRLTGLMRPGQKKYFVFQAFSLAQNDPVKLADCEFPTEEEMNAMLDAAAQSGADGAIAYCWYNLANPISSRRLPGIQAAKVALLNVFKGLSANGWP